MKIGILVVSLSLAAASTAAAQTPTYKRDVPANLATRAKVKEADAHEFSASERKEASAEKEAAARKKKGGGR